MLKEILEAQMSKRAFDLLTLGIARATNRGGAELKDTKSGQIYKINKIGKDGIYTASDSDGKSIQLDVKKGQYTMVGRNGIEKSPRKRG